MHVYINVYIVVMHTLPNTNGSILVLAASINSTSGTLHGNLTTVHPASRRWLSHPDVDASCSVCAMLKGNSTPCSICVCARVCVCVYLCVCACVCSHPDDDASCSVCAMLKGNSTPCSICVCVCVYIYIYIRTHTYICICIHTHIHTSCLHSRVWS
jgi:hypothetical protein